MYLETTSQPVVLVVPDTPRIQFRKNPKVRFQNPLTRLQLTALFVKVVVASNYAATSKSPMSFSGFSQTLSGRSQSLMPRDQRLGFDALAAS